MLAMIANISTESPSKPFVYLHTLISIALDDDTSNLQDICEDWPWSDYDICWLNEQLENEKGAHEVALVRRIDDPGVRVLYESKTKTVETFNSYLVMLVNVLAASERKLTVES
jgi:hypothetical protein